MTKIVKNWETTHLSGAAMIPHNWTREMPGDARYGTDKPTASDVTNYSQIRINTLAGAQFCDVWPNRHK